MQLVDCQKSHVISAFFMFADMLNLCIACLRIFFVPLMLAYNLRQGLLKIWTKHSLKLQEMKCQSREGLCQNWHVISAFFMYAEMLNLCIACLHILFMPLMIADNLMQGLLKVWRKYSLKLQEMKCQSREGLRGIQNYTRMDLDQKMTLKVHRLDPFL